MITLTRIINGLDIESVGAGLADTALTSISDDSRNVAPGALFIARPGAIHDGRLFITQAIERGAVAILTDDSASLSDLPENIALLQTSSLNETAPLVAERFFGSPARALTLVGITGTNGKTTVAHILKAALSEATAHPCGLIGTVSIDDGATTRPASLTTPSSIDISRSLARMRDHDCRAAILEVSSHALHQGRAAALDFDLAIFTNLSGDHLDYHGTLDDYADAKAILFERLRPDATAIVNTDDPAHERMLRDCNASILRCSASDPSADYSITPLALTLDGIRARVVTPTDDFEITSPLVGEHNLMNLLQVVAALAALGVPHETIAAPLAHAPAPPGRLQRVRTDHPDPPFTVLVDYAHTDDALQSTLRSLRPLVTGSLRLVFGCGGDRDRTKRPRMARVACANADSVIITSDNPRTEDPLAIIDDVLRGVPQDARSHAIIEPDRARAIERAVNDAKPGDLVLIAGKGHEDYQLIPDGRGGVLRRDFDDRLIAREALKLRLGSAEYAPSDRSRVRP